MKANGNAWWWIRSLLQAPFALWSLFWINLVGTIYGYYWYAGQLEDTVATKPIWLTILVPDSPTASLFFTIAVGYLLRDAVKRGGTRQQSRLRSIWEALAVAASFKYGVWAVTMILAENAHGVPFVWQDYMLMTSHVGMAVEALLYVGFFRLTWTGIGVSAIWLFASDYFDYREEIYPYLSRVLWDDLGTIEAFTWTLSVISLLILVVTYGKAAQKKTATHRPSNRF
ncbi:hypothetical protein J31TS4_07270 [Paenibacillus sp. J31TS4]|uniref:DUF1405 domain-containing protein n=1 Tax=Paenibacillus sp. J31TS4 TaxID=2807195 RepID=UPI001B216716|nr:DUF1405 domain-containing protein [Paenibacillus sp. J31TS4]GIP37447.1 hypothetical protein J31TS4_07270 [Paenibacillus sp. J31TS4]